MLCKLRVKVPIHSRFSRRAGAHGHAGFPESALIVPAGDGRLFADPEGLWVLLCGGDRSRRREEEEEEEDGSSQFRFNSSTGCFYAGWRGTVVCHLTV